MVHSAGHLCLRSVVLTSLIVAAASSAAEAQVSIQSPQSLVGFQGGASIDPEQGFVGVFWQSPPLGNRLHIRPGIDGGFGSNLRVATINVDFIVRFSLGTSGWDLIQGGGPVIALTKVDGFDDTDVSAGGSYVIGFAHESGFFSEFRIGGGNSPMLKMGAGWGIRF